MVHTAQSMLREGMLNVVRVAQGHVGGAYHVPPERVLDRRAQSHACFEWFTQRANQVMVFDNTGLPIYAAGKSDNTWDLATVGCLPLHLVVTKRRLAAQSSMPESAPAST